MKNRYDETHFSAVHRFSIKNDLKTGDYFLAMPVTTGVVDHDEQYRLSADQYRAFAADLNSAVEFVEACRRREHDDQLIYPPGRGEGQLALVRTIIEKEGCSVGEDACRCRWGTQGGELRSPAIGPTRHRRASVSTGAAGLAISPGG